MRYKERAYFRLRLQDVGGGNLRLSHCFLECSVYFCFVDVCGRNVFELGIV